MKPYHGKVPACLPLFVAFILLTVGGIDASLAQGTAFTYQGRLTDNGSLPNASYDIKFSLYDSASGGSQIGSTILLTSLPVNGGLFTAPLDFGASIFTGPPRWLKIEISPAGANTFTPLSARQPLTAAPYAVRAGDAGTLAGQSPSTFAPASGSSAYVAKAGDTMTGPLNLPPDGLAVGANQLVAAGGNIGIGTASPSALLDVFDGSFHTKLFGDFISFTRNNGPAYIWAENPGGRIDFVTGGRAVSDATANLVLNTDQSSYFNGNVGIGKNTPGAALDVNGDIIAYPNDSGNPGNIVLTAGSVDGTAFYCHSYSQPFHAYNDFTGTDVQLAVGQAGIFTGDVSVIGRLKVAQDLSWGNGTNGSSLSSDESGSIELGDSASLNTTPYIDFHHGEFGQGPQREHEDYNVRLINDDDRHLTLDGALDVTKDSGFDAHLQVGNGLGVTGDAAIHGNLAVEGVFVATVKLAVVPTSQGKRGLYCEESSQVWFADYGIGRLQGGEVVIQIDPLFAETVNLERPYHVFVQINDADAEGVAVIRKTSTSFAVKELRKGKSNAEFSYRLVALRRGFEDKRLELMPDTEKANAGTR